MYLIFCGELVTRTVINISPKIYYEVLFYDHICTHFNKCFFKSPKISILNDFDNFQSHLKRENLIRI